MKCVLDLRVRLEVTPWLDLRVLRTETMVRNFQGVVAQWTRIHLPKQGTWDQSPVQEDSTCHRAVKPGCHS